MLRLELSKYNCLVELGTTLEKLEQKSDSVVVELTKQEGAEQLRGSFKFRYVIGADGAKGDLMPHDAIQNSDRKSTRLNSSHSGESRMPSSA